MCKVPAYEEVKIQFTNREKAAQLFMPAAFINDSESEVRALESLIQTHQVGGLCFFHSRASAATNFEGQREIPYNENSLERLKQLISRYQKSARHPLLIAIDAEWGLAMRVEHGSRYPFAITLGALKPASEPLLSEMGLSMARDCRDIGIHLNLTPVVDVNTNIDNPVIGFRAFGSIPEDVGRKAATLHKGLAEGGILSCAKHFPGHGDTDMDSHLNLPVLQKNLSQLKGEELIPFRELIKAGVPVVMTGHLSLPHLDPSGLPASLSEPIIALLRNMGFEGTVITDAMNMHALLGFETRAERLNLRALQAGNDLLCYADRIPESIDLILKEVSESRLEESFQRVWRLKEEAFRKHGTSLQPKNSINSLNRELARNCICEVSMAKGLLSQFRRDGFSILSVGTAPELFINSVRTTLDFDHYPCPSGLDIQNQIPAKTRNILLTLNPPSMKPKDLFGLPESLVAQLVALSSDRQVLLYLFGNPYLIPKLPLNHFKGIVCAFQDLPAFQEMAGAHFTGGLKATGILPVKLQYGT